MSIYDEYIKNRTLFVGLSFLAITYLMLKFLSRIPHPDIFKFTKSSKQFSKPKVKIKETGEEFKPLNEYENAIMILDDFLGTSKSKYIDQFSMRGRLKN